MKPGKMRRDGGGGKHVFEDSEIQATKDVVAKMPLRARKSALFGQKVIL